MTKTSSVIKLVRLLGEYRESLPDGLRKELDKLVFSRAFQLDGLDIKHVFGGGLTYQSFTYQSSLDLGNDREIVSVNPYGRYIVTVNIETGEVEYKHPENFELTVNGEVFVSW